MSVPPVTIKKPGGLLSCYKVVGVVCFAVVRFFLVYHSQSFNQLTKSWFRQARMVVMVVVVVGVVCFTIFGIVARCSLLVNRANNENEFVLNCDFYDLMMGMIFIYHSQSYKSNESWFRLLSLIQTISGFEYLTPRRVPHPSGKLIC